MNNFTNLIIFVSGVLAFIALMIYIGRSGKKYKEESDVIEELKRQSLENKGISADTKPWQVYLANILTSLFCLFTCYFYFYFAVSNSYSSDIDRTLTWICYSVICSLVTFAVVMITVEVLLQYQRWYKKLELGADVPRRLKSEVSGESVLFGKYFSLTFIALLILICGYRIAFHSQDLTDILINLFVPIFFIIYALYSWLKNRHKLDFPNHYRPSIRKYIKGFYITLWAVSLIAIVLFLTLPRSTIVGTWYADCGNGIYSKLVIQKNNEAKIFSVYPVTKYSADSVQEDSVKVNLLLGTFDYKSGNHSDSYQIKGSEIILKSDYYPRKREYYLSNSTVGESIAQNYRLTKDYK